MFTRNRPKTGCPYKLFYADIVTKENTPHHDQETYSEKEHVLLKNFRELKTKKQKAILWLISD